MERLRLEMLPQPDDTTCGPTCLHAVYRFFGDQIDLTQVIDECPALEEGGTLAPLLGWHALGRGYQAVSYSYNLRVFDPTWFGLTRDEIVAKLHAQLEAKSDSKLQRASRAYLQYLRRGGELKMQDLSRTLLRKYLKASIPILAGLSSTYLYQTQREYGPKCIDDDIRGVPAGHFVILCGYDPANKLVEVADPYLPNPVAPATHYYHVDVDRVITAILLGSLTYDANLLIIRPKH